MKKGKNLGVIFHPEGGNRSGQMNPAKWSPNNSLSNGFFAKSGDGPYQKI